MPVTPGASKLPVPPEHVKQEGATPAYRAHRGEGLTISAFTCLPAAAAVAVIRQRVTRGRAG